MAKQKKKRSTLAWGLILLVGGYILNTTFIILDVVGYLRELTRLFVVVGLVVTIVGLVLFVIKKIRKK